MTVENTTPNRGYQLPDATNDLSDDVARVIAAIMGVDLDIATIIASLLTKADVDHDHIVADVTGLTEALLSKQDLTARGVADGYAALGSDGKVPSAQLPAALFGALSYQSAWNANTNSPTIPAATGTNKGWYFTVSVAGATTVNGVNDWEVGDWIVSNGTAWEKIDNTDQVSSVAGLRGVITAAALVAALGLDADPWASQPIGVPIPAFDDLLASLGPPKGNYVKLTAGLTGVGAYNEGLLTSETVSGSAPLVNATAVINLAGSPLLGKTIRLINSERRFLRGGVSGTLEDSENLSHAHTGTAASGGAHAHSYVTYSSDSTLVTGGGTVTGMMRNAAATTTGSGGIHTHTLSIVGSGGTEARPRNVGVTYFMRIK